MTTALEDTRTRLIGVMFFENALGSTALLGVVTVAALGAEQITGSTSLSGIPGLMSTTGGALAAGLLSAASLRFGRRPTFVFAFALSSFAALLAAIAIGTNSLFLFLLGMVLLGFGRSAIRLNRFAAGDLRTAKRRASAISLIVWASTIGAIIGPLLIGPTSSLALLFGFNELVGPLAIGVVGFALAGILAFVGLRPEPMTLTVAAQGEHSGEPSPTREILAFPTVRLAVSALVTSQFVMVLIMTMTPIHIRAHEGTLTTVGTVMMAHTLGMFALAPITGKLVDRFGARRMIMIAIVTMAVSAVIAMTASGAETTTLIVAMFLVGLGWCFGFVSASAELQIGLPIADRLKIQGVADSITWISGGAGAAISGVVLGLSSYPVLAIVALFSSFIPVPFLAKAKAEKSKEHVAPS